jgi:hypothetical protein
MKEILSSQYDAVSGGWQDADGSGHRSSSNGGSGSSSSGGNNGNDHSLQSFLSQNSPYGSGSGASGVWGGSSTMDNSRAGGNGGRNH